MARETRAYCSANSCDFIFGLKRFHAKTFVPRQFVQNVRRRRNRIRTVKQGTRGELRGSNKSECSRLVACDLAVLARRDLRLLYRVVSGKDLSCVGEVITRAQRDFVRLGMS